MRNLVIIPTYNEKENVRSMVERLFSLYHNVDLDILIIDDNSPDGTAQIVIDLQKSFPTRLHLLQRSGKLGLGTAYITGFKWAIENNYEYICEMDCDFSHNPEDLIKLFNTAHQGVDFVIGSRYSEGVNVVNWPLKRLLISYGASFYVRRITNMPIMDPTAGFVCYSAKALKTMNLDSIAMKGYGFQIEMKYTLWKLGLSHKEVSIIFVDRKLGSSKMSSSIFGEAFWGVIGLRFRKIRKK